MQRATFVTKALFIEIILIYTFKKH